MTPLPRPPQTCYAPAMEPANPDFVVIDVETACARVSSICQIGIVGFRDGREVFAWETLVDPRDDFAAFNIGIHGITPRHVAGAPTFGDLHAVIDGHLRGRVTVAHSWFDKGALAAACRVGDYPLIETHWLDSVRVAKTAWPQLASHRLNVLAQFLGIAHRHHDALSDARAAGLVIVRAIEHTGIDLASWLAGPVTRRARSPAAAVTGPLCGERVAILGEPRDGALAHAVAAAGGRVVAGVGKTTTMLVIAACQPYGRHVAASEPHRRAQNLRLAGSPIVVLTEDALRAQLAQPTQPGPL